MSGSVPEVSLFDHDTPIDPYSAYKTLRDQAPVHFEPGFVVYIVTRYDLIREAICDIATPLTLYSSIRTDWRAVTLRELQQAVGSIRRFFLAPVSLDSPPPPPCTRLTTFH